MKMRQRDLACWIATQMTNRGIDMRDTSVWAGGVTYMPQIEDARNGSLEYLLRQLAATLGSGGHAEQLREIDLIAHEGAVRPEDLQLTLDGSPLGLPKPETDGSYILGWR